MLLYNVFHFLFCWYLSVWFNWNFQFKQRKKFENCFSYPKNKNKRFLPDMLSFLWRHKRYVECLQPKLLTPSCDRFTGINWADEKATRTFYLLFGVWTLKWSVTSGLRQDDVWVLLGFGVVTQSSHNSI